MAPEKEIFDLDESAQALYRQFEGIDDADRTSEIHVSRSELVEYLNKEEKILDYFRLLLAQATCVFAEILTNSRFAVLSKENDQKIRVFLGLLNKIATYPKFDGAIHCRLRGKQKPEESTETEIGSSETYDYELSVGNLLLDYNMAQVVEQKEKVRGKAIFSKLMNAFKGLSVLKIFNFSIVIGEGGEIDYKRIDSTIRHLVNYYKSGDETNEGKILDEYGQPNINLTLLAKTNRVKLPALQNLVNKIKPKLLGDKPAEEFKFFTTAYDVILASKRYKKQLPKMPIEINNVQWLTENLRSNKKKTTEAVQASRLVLSKYGNNPKMASEVISSISSEGYNEIQSDVMSKRLSLATDFLDLAEVKDNRGVQKEALGNIEAGLDHVPDEIYDRLTIENGKVVTKDDSAPNKKWSLHKNLFGLISFFKQRSETKKKVRSIANKNIQFNTKDYSVIARNFNVSEIEASHLIDLLRNCFNKQGRFRRIFFENNIPKFLQYGNRVFSFLWHYFKDVPIGEDRVSFLNALPLLVNELKPPQDSFKILLSDIFTKSAISFSDRNGLILCNIMLRTENIDAGNNIELTPEEVLQDRCHLDHEMVEVALDFMDKHHELLMRKIRNLTKLVLKSASQENLKEGEMQPKFLMFLLREIVIFFSLVGGETAQSIILGITREFGHPRSFYYNTQPESEELRHALNLLHVSIRALRRLQPSLAESLSAKVLSKEDDFIKLSPEPAHEVIVKKIIEKIRLG